MSIVERVSTLQEQVRHHADGRAVTVVAVSKYASVAQIREAYQAGLRHFGENRVQDAIAKMAQFPASDYPDLHWHFIGSLQTNKVNKTIRRFTLIHSIDSLHLAQAVSAANAAQETRQAVLLQVNPPESPERRGFSAEEADSAFDALCALPGLDIRGLMIMAPPQASFDEDSIRLNRTFDGLRRLRDRLREKSGRDLPELSMGMSRDFPYALANGATIIRVGNYLFQAG